jgi:small ligand-binding sensory domain FIST
VRVLSEPKLVSAVQGYDLLTLGDKLALETLRQAYFKHHPHEGALPLHHLMLGIAENPAAAMCGDYRLSSLVSANDADGSVTLALTLQPGQTVLWLLREAAAAQRDLEETVLRLQTQLATRPDFGLLFSCMGRGPYFYDGVDRDLELLRLMLPATPLIGFYGNGEIAPINGVNELLQYSAVLGLFSRVQS